MGKLENHFKTGLEIIILKSKGKSLRGWYMAQYVAMLEVAMHTCLRGLIGRRHPTAVAAS